MWLYAQRQPKAACRYSQSPNTESKDTALRRGYFGPDPESESLVHEALEAKSRGRTTIVVAHRLSSIAKADRIYVLECGRLIETGTHAELVQKRGMYRELLRMQSLQ
jgi:ABC-type uncharacterized transport system ATPase subunit